MKSMQVAAAIAMLMLATVTVATRAESEPVEAAAPQEAHNASGTDQQQEVVCTKEYRAGSKIRERVCHKKAATETQTRDETSHETNP